MLNRLILPLLTLVIPLTALPCSAQNPHPWQPAGDYSVDRPRLSTTMHAPVQLIEKAPGHYFVDFGQAAFGSIYIAALDDFDLAADAVMEVHMGEKRGPNNTVDREPGGTIRYRKMDIIPSKLPWVIHGGIGAYVPVTPDERNTGAAAILMPEAHEVLPFRYAELINVPGKLTKDNLRQVAVHYRFNDSDSAFNSSDETLNELFDFCKYTMKATSFCGVFVDGDRERIPYEADAYINMLGWYAVTREYTLPRFSNEYLIQHPTWPTEWQLHIPMMMWADYMHTGDTDSIAMFYDDVRAKTLIDLARKDGLISTTDGRFTPEVAEAIGIDNIRDIVDWPKGERDGYELLPYNTVVNAFHYEALKKMADLAAALDKNDDAEFFQAQAKKVYDAFNKTFFDEEQGLYIDGEGSKHASQHANMWALAFGLVPEQRQEKVTAFVKSKEMACSVYAAQYLLEAMYLQGEADHAFHLMTNDSDRSFPHMWRNVGSTIALEAWDIKYKPNLDWNHAWGAAPANIIPRFLMGVEPLEPGFAKVRVRPQLGPVEHASMKLPTIRGPIEMNVKQTPDGPFTLSLDIPANMWAEVWLPAKHGEKVTIDGNPSESFKRRGDWYVIDNVGSGGHAFVVE